MDFRLGGELGRRHYLAHCLRQDFALPAVCGEL